MKSKTPVAALVVAAVLFLSGFALMWADVEHWLGTRSRPHANTPVIAMGALPTIDHIVLIVEENKSELTIVDNPDAPYINSLMHTYATTSHYFAATWPSLPNYIALTSGTLAGIDSNCVPGPLCQADVPNIGDSLEKARKTWRAYMEDMPGPCSLANGGLYAVRHNPFIYYPDIVHNETRCQQHVVPFTQFSKDLASLPDYTFITPNLCSDMHDCSVSTGDSWLAAHVPAILASPAFTKEHSLLIITWDEDEHQGGSGEVPAIFVGPAAKRGYVATTFYDHYALLHTIEAIWHLPTLASNDSPAPLMTEMLQ
jgi:phospholipase C